MGDFADNTPFTVNITPSTSAYGAGDVVGGKLQFTTAGRVRTGIITHITIADDDNEGAAYKLWLYAADPTTIADNAVFAPVMTDHQKLIGIISVATTDYLTVNSQKIAKVPVASVAGTPEHPIAFWSGTMYGYLVTEVSTPTFAASKTIHVRLHVVGGS